MQTWDLVKTLKIEGDVHLQKTERILLAGDAVEVQDDWDNRRITSEHPPFGQPALRARFGRCGDGEPACSGFV